MKCSEVLLEYKNVDKAVEGKTAEMNSYQITQLVAIWESEFRDKSFMK